MTIGWIFQTPVQRAGVQPDVKGFGLLPTPDVRMACLHMRVVQFPPRFVFQFQLLPKRLDDEPFCVEYSGRIFSQVGQ